VVSAIFLLLLLLLQAGLQNQRALFLEGITIKPRAVAAAAAAAGLSVQ
jgi:hypothetical protein